MSHEFFSKMSSARTRRRRPIKSASAVEKTKRLALHEKLEDEDLHAIHTAFQATETKSMDRRQFQRTLLDICKIDYSDVDFDTLFLKINRGR